MPSGRGQHMNKPKLSFWLVAGLGLIWNLMGCMNFLVQSDPEIMAALGDEYALYKDLIANRPAWATAAFAIAVFGGAVGCILLLLRRRVALQVLILSLFGTVVVLAQAIMVVGLSSEVLISTGMSVIVALVLVWTGRTAAAAGWLR